MLKHRIRAIILLVAVAVLILDSRTAVHGAEDGIQLCFRTLIPSLFPLIFATTMLLPYLPHTYRSGQSLLCKLYRIPEGTEGLLLAGLLGGYPVGARGVAQSVVDGRIAQDVAPRMLVFCNACGPAFIFGVGFCLFQNQLLPWIAWGIHILSSLLIARLLPATPNKKADHYPCTVITLQEGLRRSIRSMTQICGWVILLRVVINVLEKWFLRFLPSLLQTIIVGLLELSNGCLSLATVSNDIIRFVLYTAFIGFGGICVALQSIGAMGAVSSRLYFPGKILQCNISAFLSGLVCLLIFGFHPAIPFLLSATAVLILICLFWLRKIQNRAGILSTVVV